MNSDIKDKVKAIFKIALTIVCLIQISFVSYDFFSSFGNNSKFWSCFYGIMGVVLDIVFVYLINFEESFQSKILAFCLLTLSLVVFSIDSYKQAPDIIIADKTISSAIEDSNKLLNDTAKALNESITKTDGGYGTSNSKTANAVVSIVNSKLKVAQVATEYNNSVEKNKQMELFKIVGEKFNINVSLLLMIFLFLRGALLEVSLLVLSHKPKEKSFSISQYLKNYLISKLPYIKPKKGRPRKNPFEVSPKINKDNKKESNSAVSTIEKFFSKDNKPVKRVLKSVPEKKPKKSVIGKSLIAKKNKDTKKLPDEKVKTFFNDNIISDEEAEKIVSEIQEVADITNKDSSQEEY